MTSMPTTAVPVLRRIRPGVARVLEASFFIVAVGAVGQIASAAFGIFSLMQGAAVEDAFAAHHLIGYATEIVAVLLVLSLCFAGAARRVTVMGFVAFGLLLLQPVLQRLDSPYLGAVHGINALLIFVLCLASAIELRRARIGSAE